uniref:Uncharacterized protein n=1 Tax=Timema shepardi TaxID=629360 RepID=A0A7R9B4S7_TIMSH|nr:unnamed protein product [Timema shepardi]
MTRNFSPRRDQWPWSIDSGSHHHATEKKKPSLHEVTGGPGVLGVVLTTAPPRKTSLHEAISGHGMLDVVLTAAPPRNILSDFLSIECEVLKGTRIWKLFPHNKAWGRDLRQVAGLVKVVQWGVAEFYVVELHHFKEPCRRGNHKCDKLSPTSTYIRNNQRIITIQNDADTLCLALVLAVAKAVCDVKREPGCMDVNTIKYIKIGRPILKLKAEELCRDARVTLLKGGGITELKQIQAYLSEYKITVFRERWGRQVLYEGPTPSEHSFKGYMDLYFHNDKLNHFDVITSLTDTFKRSYVLHEWHVPFSNKNEHKLESACKNRYANAVCSGGIMSHFVKLESYIIFDHKKHHRTFRDRGHPLEERRSDLAASSHTTPPLLPFPSSHPPSVVRWKGLDPPEKPSAPVR